MVDDKQNLVITRPSSHRFLLFSYKARWRGRGRYPIYVQYCNVRSNKIIKAGSCGKLTKSRVQRNPFNVIQRACDETLNSSLTSCIYKNKFQFVRI